MPKFKDLPFGFGILESPKRYSVRTTGEALKYDFTIVDYTGLVSPNGERLILEISDQSTGELIVTTDPRVAFALVRVVEALFPEWLEEAWRKDHPDEAPEPG